MSVPCSDTYVPFCPILCRWVGFQMARMCDSQRAIRESQAQAASPPAGQRGGGLFNLSHTEARSAVTPPWGHTHTIASLSARYRQVYCLVEMAPIEAPFSGTLWAAHPPSTDRAQVVAGMMRFRGNYTFFLKFILENEIFLDNLKFFVVIFSNLNFFILEVDSESLSTLQNINFKREASRVEGYVTPSCTETRLSVRNLRKFENV